MKPAPDQRHYGIRRDINDLVRDESGKISGAKIGTYIGQGIAAKLLLVATPLPTWDVLGILFTVLIAPEMLKKLLTMKYGGGDGMTTTMDSKSSETTTRKVTK